MTGRMKPLRLLYALLVLAGTLALVNCPNPILDQINQRAAQANVGVSPFTSFSITSALNNSAGVVIDCLGQISGADVVVTVPYGTNVTGLIATFNTRTGGTLTVGSTTQSNGATANNFTSPVQYTLKATDGSTYTGTVTVNVAPSGVLLNQTSLSLAVGGPTGMIQASVTPASGSTTLLWSSSNTAVATVSPGGLPLTEVVTPVAIGTATIVAKTVDGSKSASCVVTITNPIAVTGVTAYPSYNGGGGSTTLAVGGTAAWVQAFITPSNATNQDVVWSSSNVSVVKVSPLGIALYEQVTPVGVGTATVTVTTADGAKSASITFTVNAAVAITGVSLPLTASVAQGGTVRLSAVITPSNATNQSLAWTTANAANVTVSSSGDVTGVVAGTTAVITATAIDGSNASASCLVNVTAPVLVTGVVLNQPTMTLSVTGSSGYLQTTIAPTTATKPAVTWSTSDATIASIAYSGSSYASITPVAAGTATITATSTDGSLKTATCTVTVTAPVAVTSVTLSPTTLNLALGGNNQYINSSVSPSNASKPQVTWASSDPLIASISSSGSSYAYITPVAVGTATITATSTDGSNKTATCTVNVTAPVAVTSVALNSSSMSLTVGGSTGYLYTSFLPSNATNQSVTWTTSNASVANMSQSWSTGAYIAGLGVGTATITATTADGSNKTATCTVTVTAPVAVTGVMLNYTSMSVTVGASPYNASLSASFLPSNATNKSVTWSSSDPTVVSLYQSSSSYTYLSGITVGTATITATSVDGGFTAICKVTAVAAVSVTGVAVSPLTLALNVGGTPNPASGNLYVTFTPSNPTNYGTTWVSSNTAVAIVSSGGQVTAIAAGTATITVTTVDGGFTATCAVTVSP